MAFISGSASTATTSSRRRLASAGDILPGPNIANHAMVSTPGTPASAMVGMSSRPGSRLVPLTASMRSVPALWCDITVSGLVNPTGIWPPASSCIMGAAPL